MIHSVERGTDVKKGEKGDLVLVDGRVNVGKDSEDRRFSGVVFAEARLIFWEQVVGGQVVRELRQDELLDDFGHKRKV